MAKRIRSLMAKRIRSLLAIVLLLFVFFLNTEGYAVDDNPVVGIARSNNTVDDLQIPDAEARIAEIKEYGNVVLSVNPESMIALGYEPADIIRVKIGDAEMEMPIGTNYSDVDSGELICCFKIEEDKENVVLALNEGNFAVAMGIAERRVIDGDPGYQWVFPGGKKQADITVTISMAEEQGYVEEYALHQLSGTRSNNRGDYPLLTDAEYANFRDVGTSGIGTATLFRSSSPINPSLNRNGEADEALYSARIRTVLNMADSEETMNEFPGFSLTHYSDCDIIPMSMGMDFFSKEFQQKLAEGFRYLASHDGPYLIHCKEGKDRTGFAAAILECLMGADADEVVRDYMLTYANFYGTDKNSSAYVEIANGSIEASLARAFNVHSIRDDNTDLQQEAQSYLEGIGMSEEEISLLREKLGEDYGGLSESRAA